MRIAVGQLWQETNTFNRNPTTLSDFEHWGLVTGEKIIEEYGDTGELSGFLGHCRQWDPSIEFVGLVRCVCWPWGAVDGESWRRIRGLF